MNFIASSNFALLVLVKHLFDDGGGAVDLLVGMGSGIACAKQAQSVGHSGRQYGVYIYTLF